MSRFTKGDRERIDLLDTTDPEHDQYHGMPGPVVEILQDDLVKVTGERAR